MQDSGFLISLGTAVGLMLVLEGMIYALFPKAMKNMMHQILSMPAHVIRRGGLIAAVIGAGIVWFFKTVLT
ncbi:MAG: DUF2065 domain-containing protein [Alphaproteobacteria bacterium]|nr:DUF2065 domain-containing protein [Alphaproteobacteria bacterium]